MLSLFAAQWSNQAALSPADFAGSWILLDGTWNDAGDWDDTALWID